MTATSIELRDFVEGLHVTTPDDLHPAAQVTIGGWLQEMIHAADINDAATVARLGQLVSDKIELELKWEGEGPRRPPHGA